MAKSGLGIARDSLGQDKSKLSSDDRAKLDMFMSMYGIFDPTNDADSKLARSKITDVECK
jgi:hypothetical protein